MAESKVDLIKDVFSKSQYTKIIDNNFNELGVTTINQDLQNQTTVADFFNLYNELFYEIPSEGETNSHRYLVEQSGEYINFDDINDEIEALREEITQLRQELLQTQIQNVTNTVSGSISPSDTAEFNRLNSELSNITNQLSEVNLPTE
tara:strand:+ start:924 stop:1367 length:444 start_codon:yes stop_codon:yes gene_type:complete